MLESNICHLSAASTPEIVYKDLLPRSLFFNPDDSEICNICRQQLLICCLWLWTRIHKDWHLQGRTAEKDQVPPILPRSLKRKQTSVQQGVLCGLLFIYFCRFSPPPRFNSLLNPKDSSKAICCLYRKKSEWRKRKCTQENVCSKKPLEKKKHGKTFAQQVTRRVEMKRPEPVEEPDQRQV